MKKFNKLFLMFLLLISLFIGFINSNKYEVSASSDEIFKNVECSINKNRENGQTKVTINFSCYTEKRIRITNVISTIVGQVEQNIPETMETKIENGYFYEFDHDVYNWQIGTLKLEIQYTLLENFDLDNPITEKFIIVGDKWVKEEVDWNLAFAASIIITLGVVIATFIIIENSKKGYTDSESEE